MCSRCISGRNVLDGSKGVAECGDVGGDVLVDAVEGDAVVSEVRERGEVEVVGVPREAGADAEGEFGLKVMDLARVNQYISQCDVLFRKFML